MKLDISLWILRFMMQSKPDLTRWFLLSVRIFENEFKEVIGDRIAGICSEHNVTVDYAFQDINDIPGVLPEGRTKPWGTGQAVLAAKDVSDNSVYCNQMRMIIIGKRRIPCGS